MAQPALRGYPSRRPLSRRRAEAIDCLWTLLRSGDFRDWRFRRQHPLGPFVVDFACIEQALVIEVAAESPGLPSDDRRILLERLGYRVLRFSDGEVLGNLRAVRRAIASRLE